MFVSFKKFRTAPGSSAFSEEVRALSDVSRAVSSSLDLRQVLDAVAGYAVNLSKSDGCGVFELTRPVKLSMSLPAIT